MGTLWQNKTQDLCIQKFGPDEYNRLVRKASQASEGGLFSSKPSLSGKAKKMVANSSHNILRRCHAVGAVGYAVVMADDRVPSNDFFIQGRRFRLRFRHSNVNCDDDAASCQREAAVKFADQNEDGPLDLILFTGRTAPARNSKGLGEILKLTSPNEVRSQCERDPTYYFSLVDGLRRAPTSFAHLTYNSQMPYQFTPSDGQPRVVRFRLIPGKEGVTESGLLDDRDQVHPWETGRRNDERRDAMYLRNEFIVRLRQDEPISYILQIQVASASNQSFWDPQTILNEDIYPWLNVMKLELTTFLPTVALRHTFFNIIQKPKCLLFPNPSSPSSPLSYQKLWSGIYTQFELKRKRQVIDDADDERSSDLVRYEVTIQTKALNDGRVPSVDIAITLAGTQSRSTPRLLTQSTNLNLSPKDGMERYEVEAEDVGELLAVNVAVKYRQLADDWYLRYVTVSDAHDRNRIHRFPCHAIVLNNTTLRNGEASLAHKQNYEIHRQQRLLDLSQKQNDYTWLVNGHSWPSQIRGRTVQQLPDSESQRAAKYNGMLWQIDQELVEFFRSIRFRMATTGDVHGFPGSGSASVRSTFQSAGAVMNRQMSLQAGGSAADARRRTMMIRQLSVDVTPVYSQDTATEENTAAARWKKIKRQVKVISESKIPEGSKGEMCREVQNDVEFARIFTGGMNPMLMRQCRTIPTNFPVTQDTVVAILDRKKSLDEEIKDGRVYLVDYSLLDGIPVIHRDADHRYMVAPLVLLYVRSNGDLVPLAIQLNQTPGSDNPIWTPTDRPEQWMLAKLWVRCADFQWAFAIAHYFRCHSLMEPFAVATMRQLSTAHPVYKLMKPHFRYTIATNTLMRNNVFKKGGLLDRYTSLGFDGFQALISRYAARFSFEELDPNNDFKAREVDDDRKLPNYFYRDDSIRLWTCLQKCYRDVLDRFYETPEDVAKDDEISEWLRELHKVGFPNLTESQRRGLPRRFESVADVADLVTKVIFTLTAQHSATHSDAVDFLGFVPDIPAMMRVPPPNSRNFVVDREFLTRALPDQFPDAYYGTLAYVMQLNHKPDENILGVCDEVYFVEPEVLAIFEDFQKSLTEITTTQRARNIIAGYLYENLMPAYIPTSAEPLPFVPRDRLRKALKGLGPHLCRDIIFRETQASVPLMALPLCRQFARTLGGRSTISRRLTMSIVKGLKASPKDSGASVAVFDEEDEYGDIYPHAKRQPMRESRLRSSNF